MIIPNFAAVDVLRGLKTRRELDGVVMRHKLSVVQTQKYIRKK